MGIDWACEIKGTCFASHVSEKEGDGPDLAIADKLISQFPLAQIRKIRKSTLKLDLREEQR